jgi:HAE1 family hydrophobic/amphiphilic exporter-1
MDYEISYDVSKFLDASIEKVIHTLVEAFILVGLVVFLFLGDWRSTLIPAIAVPVSLIGTFIFMQFFGITLNLITLFALVLAIGIVVDNAIVVIEAVHAKWKRRHLSPLKATEEAMHEISGAIIAITFVMAAVFIPVAFMSGPVGIFLPAVLHYHGNVHYSFRCGGIDAYACTLCHDAEEQSWKAKKKTPMDKILNGFNNWFNRLTGQIQKLLGNIVNRRVITFLMLIAFAWVPGC